MKILLIDDHKLIKMAVTMLIEENIKDVKIDSATSYKEFLSKINLNTYDIILCDITLKDATGYDVLTYLDEKKRQEKTIVLSMHEDKNYVKKAIRLGAKGYVAKSSAHEEIILAIEKVINGEIYLKKEYQDIFYDLYTEKDQILSDREREVLEYIVKGYTLTEIGEKLFLSVKTIDTYKKRLMEKLGLKKRSELIDYYQKELEI
ncbi:response regulator transcription factor [Gemelliphila asaccharolytica]|uniref:Response regulator receiver domain protein n=1 Tax=Gemelliphila asaccharolytica TaxID=502393 RepID=A0ABR5TN80_9BACL|nr:response regulator transcription factor [Gemella asaccharolytica]KXB58849.1 response regulator receiver domain protein [Gemella asaccharolytica]